MERPIKFRARDLIGEMRFGHYVMHDKFPYITERGNYWEVEEDSIAQLVGYDKDGNEVYEGDIATDYAGHEYYAALWGNVTKDDTLKEAIK